MAALCLAVLSVLTGHSAHAEQQHPNVILMMADDLGYGDLACYGSERQVTPRLDQMAREGLKLTNYHAGASVCSPSRMALLSGSYPRRLGWPQGVVGYLMPRGKGMSLDVYTIGEAFKDAGYRTAMVGKWHVGMGDLRPMNQGFDQTYYINNSNNMDRDMYRGEKLVQKDFDNRRLSETFTEEVIRQIKTDSDKPFFIYVPFTAPHFPAEAHPDWDGHSKNEAYGDVVEELDYRVGQILDTLKEQGIDKQTLVIFTSDNGPEGGQRRFASAGELSGRKWMSREGGTRVPCIVRWPGVIEPDTQNDALTSAIDLFPTLATASNIELDLPDEAQKMDGVSVWTTWLGKDAPHPRNQLMYWHGKGRSTAIQKDGWKLFFDAGDGDPDTSEGPVLFNLSEDVAESQDLSEQHPEKVKQLLDLATQKLEDIEQHSLPLGDANSK